MLPVSLDCSFLIASNVYSKQNKTEIKSSFVDLYFTTMPCFSLILIICKCKWIINECCSVVWINMTWLTVTEYLCHKWPQICSICPEALPGVFLIHDLSRACNYSNTTGATSGAGTVYDSEALKFFFFFFFFFHLVDRKTLGMWIVHLSSFELQKAFSNVCRVKQQLEYYLHIKLLCLIFWPLCCLSFFVLQILITSLVSSSSSNKQYWAPLYRQQRKHSYPKSLYGVSGWL